MDPISSAIITALSKMAEPAVKDAYEALKKLLVRRFGANSEVATAVQKLEDKPDSTGRRETLKEEVVSAKAGEVPEILQAAQTLSERMKVQPAGQQVIQQTVAGNQNIFSGSGNVSVDSGTSGSRR